MIAAIKPRRAPRPRRTPRAIPVTDDRMVGTARAIASLMRADGATHRISMGPRSRARTVHLYGRVSRLDPNAFATCAVVQIAPNLWRAEGWIHSPIDTHASPARRIPVAQR